MLPLVQRLCGKLLTTADWFEFARDFGEGLATVAGDPKNDPRHTKSIFPLFYLTAPLKSAGSQAAIVGFQIAQINRES